MNATASSPLPRFRFAAPASLVSIVRVAAGLILAVTVHMGWLIVFGLGAFGPALLRELGLLRDHDELQREVSLRAGQRAFLATGILLVAWIATRKWGVANLDGDGIPASTALACLVVTHFMSRLTGFWGAQRAATRILVSFGVLWLVFAGLSVAGDPPEMMGRGALMTLLIVGPFFALAWTCRRWPRITGILVIACAIAAFVLFRLQRILSNDPSALLVALTFALPLLVVGVALVGVKSEGDEA